MKKSKLRLWIELLAVITVVACVVAVFFVTVGAATGESKIEGIDDEPAETHLSQPQLPPTQAAQSQSAETKAAQILASQTAATVQTYDGVITDTKCGARHTPAAAGSAADCTRTCVHAGESFALVDGDKIYVLQGEPELLKHEAGQRVTIGGTLNGTTISVASVREITP
jgi:hypothetical protein